MTLWAPTLQSQHWTNGINMTDALQGMLFLDTSTQLQAGASVQQTENPHLESEHETIWFAFRTVGVRMRTVCCTDCMLLLNFTNEGHNVETKHVI